MQLIKPHWPAPSNIFAYTTTRLGGQSQGDFAAFNLALHVQDDTQDVLHNRETLKKQVGYVQEPIWLLQTHSNQVLYFTEQSKFSTPPNFDAAITNQSQRPCVVLTADCLPILICNITGTEVAAIHAGWRGLANGIIDNTITTLKSKPEDLLIWLGPAISKNAYEVGIEVKDEFVKKDSCFEKGFSKLNEKIFADLYHLAKINLYKLGVKETQVYGGEYCTYSQPELFYSYRYAKGKTGRIASLIWIGM